MDILRIDACPCLCRRLVVRTLIGALLATAVATTVAADEPNLTVEKTDDGAVVKIDGKVFTAYLIKSGSKPVLWPIYGPTGKAMTRAYPVADRREHEREDHIHHRSFWFTHGGVNGIDFWLEPRNENQTHGLTQHREFLTLSADGTTATIKTANDWLNGKTKQKICEDTRRLDFMANDAGRWIDFSINIRATNGDVTFADTKEGTFGVRVAGTMKVDAKMGGKILNSEGVINKEAWGQPAEWVDYTGPVDGETVGVAMFSHPDNFRHPCRWHVRTYGLFTANPFGLKDFPKSEHKQGVYTINSGDELTLRYGVLFHAGELDKAALDKAYASYKDRQKQ